MNLLKLSGQEIHSLAELRQYFDHAQVMETFGDGSLEAWLDACYYEREADMIRSLPQEESSSVEQQLLDILGVNLATTMTPEQRTVYERKCTVIRQYSNNTDLLSHAMETATNQAELAELLNNGLKTIYLCHGSFSIPIRKGGIRYIGIGKPQIDTPFTEEQYRQANITFENVPFSLSKLTQTTVKEPVSDCFETSRCHLAIILHEQLKSQKQYEFCRLSKANDDAMEVANVFFDSKSEAEKAARDVVQDAYKQANSYFIPGNVQCLAGTLAKRYAAVIRHAVGDIPIRFQTLPEKREQAVTLAQLVDRAEQKLENRFAQELRGSADYYWMYKKSYFLDMVEIEENDYNGDEDDPLALISRFLKINVDYDIQNLFEVIRELEQDVQSHADTFFGCAYDIFQKYCAEIETLAEEIGRDISDEDLKKLGISFT